MKKMDNSKFMEMINAMIETVEALLDRYEINIPNEEKEEEDGASNIYGMDYAMLSDTFEAILADYDVVTRENN